MNTPPRLSGKVAIVTGAGSTGAELSNGRAVAIRFAQEGARVVAVDRSLEAAEATAAAIGDSCLPLQADVSRPEQVAAMVDTCLTELGRVDVLHNNVGIGSLGGPETEARKAWDLLLRVNLKSVLLTTRAVLPTMIAQGSGSIINISSLAGLAYWGVPSVAYASTKAALNQMSRLIAHDHARYGIRCNVIAPGLIDTPTAHLGLLPVYGGDPAELRRRQESLAPARRMGRPEEIAAAAVFLASDESRYVSGVVLPVDGGLATQMVSPECWAIDDARDVEAAT
ncbi:SDR family NAD(P)-dependent oxidoreductase [Nocardioides humi]|uniref:Glucose 1-dehydrogenase n=1 Tax=Nocardioides humi TaxID=449461 RepID=A0ABN2BRS6_9ACTN|nr:SDR family oxidoreductase [Nocardioides humi]